MLTYTPPIREFQFLLKYVYEYEDRVACLQEHSDTTLDVVEAVIDGIAKFVRSVLLPINLHGDLQGCFWKDGLVSTPDGYRSAYMAYCDGGWPSLAADPEYGGQGLPSSLTLIAREVIGAGSMAFGMYGGLSQGVYRAISAHGGEQLKSEFLPELASGRWTGTMCLTEPHAGSDLSLISTRATPRGDESFSITGTKIFISGGDHDLTENIVHLVLARLSDAPPGTRGLSLFIVPKRIRNKNRELADNSVTCGSIEHKMGIRASATAVLHFDESKAWLIGEPHGGLRAMFTMMNSSRVGVAALSVGVAELSYQNAVAYSRERVQGQAPGGAWEGKQAIIEHPDVRRSLLMMKTLVEGTRAMYVDAAILLDVKARDPSPIDRKRAELRLALLTPVLKSFISESAVQVTDLGIQVFGGHGYIHMNGMEQLLRDARIVPLYEGTNGIQALDLVYRKITLENGSVVREYFHEIEALTSTAAGHDITSELAVKLARALFLLRDATTSIQQRPQIHSTDVAASATDYLRLFGLVALGYAWLRMAIAAAIALGNNQLDADYCCNKINTARFYYLQMLPEVEQRYEAINTIGDTVSALSNDDF